MATRLIRPDVSLQNDSLMDSFASSESMYTSFSANESYIAGTSEDNSMCEVCQLPRSSSDFMICCDECALWVHGNCARISLEEASVLVKENQKYTCHDCLPQAPHPCPLCPKQFPPGHQNDLWQHINRAHISQSLFPQPSFFVRYSAGHS